MILGAVDHGRYLVLGMQGVFFVELPDVISRRSCVRALGNSIITRYVLERISWFKLLLCGVVP